MKGLRISSALELPIDVAGESTAILAKKGAGKSNTAKVIVEETLDHGGVQVIVLDPIGHWWSLRAGADGKRRGGYPVAVFGGMHGDLPLEETAGKLLAQTAVESGQSMILDVSSLDSNGAMQRFVYELLEELYRLKQGTPTPLLLVLEEADEFAPQDSTGKNVPRMVGAANRISKRGRGRGIGMLYVTQRSAALNKNVLDQADTLIVMRTMGPRDRKAIEGWVKHQDAAGMDEVLPSLPSLQTGEAWVWTPQRNLLQRVKIRKARTFDSSWTPRPGETAIVADVKPIDVKALGAAIAATVERVKANDPAELRKQIRELDAKASNLEGKIALLERVTAAPEPVETIVEVPVLTDTMMKQLATTIAPAANAAAAIKEHLDALAELYTKLAEIPTSTPGERPEQKRAARPVVEAVPRVPAARPLARPAPARTEPGDGEISDTEQRILDALAWYEAFGIYSPSKIAIGLLAGYRVTKKLGGNYGSSLGKLRNAGLIDYPGRGDVTLTDAGRAIARDPGIELTNEAFHSAVYQRLESAEVRILENLIEAYPQPIDKVELGQMSGYNVTAKLGGNFGSALGKLRLFGLIDYPARGVAVAHPVLFPEEAAAA